jgi:carbonic anhydrase/acetyltransferase-like protein (isoleucine patch superfamily)
VTGADGALVLALTGDRAPVVDENAWLAPSATVVGDVHLEAGASIWYGAVIRADNATITVGRDSNLQDNVTAHADPGFPLAIGERVSVGHNAVLHGCTVEADVLIGMGAIIMNGAHVGSGSLVAAGALLTQGMVVPPGSLVTGVPAKIRRRLSEAERASIARNAAVYRDQAREHRAAHRV